jgi:hypothetical protein
LQLFFSLFPFLSFTSSRTLWKRFYTAYVKAFTSWRPYQTVKDWLGGL